MKKLIFIVLFCMLSAVQAETLYISHVASVIMRAAPNHQAAITRTIAQGTPVELIKSLPKFDLVRTEKDAQGWVAAGFLSSKLPQTMPLSLMQKASDFVQQSFITIRDKFFAGTQHKIATSSTLNPGQLISKTQQLEKENNLLRNENSKLQLYNDLKWFLTGAGVMLVGFILGLLFARLRKKRKWHGGWD